MGSSRTLVGGGGTATDGFVFSLGPETNTFGDATTANKAAAEALVDTYATNNASWLAEYDANRNFFIQLEWTGGGEALQRRNLAGDDWEDVTSVIQGQRGPGPTDAQIQAEVKEFARIGGRMVAKADLAADVGFPQYSLNAVYEAANDRIVGTVRNVADPSPPYIAYMVVPAGIDRKNVDLTLVIGSQSRALKNPQGIDVRARHLTPSALLPVVTYGTDSYRFLEPLGQRPQDFRAHFFLFEADNALEAYQQPDYLDSTHTLTQALVDAATNKAQSGLRSPKIVLPTNYTPSKTYAEGVEVAGGLVRGLFYAGFASSDDIQAGNLASAGTTMPVATGNNATSVVRFPDTADTYAWFAVPEASGDPIGSIRIGGNTVSDTVFVFTKKAGTINDANGVPLSVWTYEVQMDDTIADEWLRIRLPAKSRNVSASISLAQYIAVPEDAPDVRALGIALDDSEGWDGILSLGFDEASRVAGTFNIGGVAHKFVRWYTQLYEGFDMDYNPTGDWADWNPNDAYYIVAFTGLDDPVDE